MTENIPQTSASERVEAARKLADHLEQMMTTAQWMPASEGIQAVHVLRALVTPPAVGESETEIANASLRWYNDNFGHTIASIDGFGTAQHITAMVMHAVRTAIQSAHESWEPADVPSQEFMLRHLGITYSQSTTFGALHIPEQLIDLEVI